MRPLNSNDTIAAPVTPSGRGGVSIVRVSGPLTQEIAKKILKEIPEPRHAAHKVFLNESDEAIDEGIALFFQNPNSFTGEDVLELQGHGGYAVVNGLMKRILSLGARLAKPGEFSERAFLNGKIDLSQAEAIADLIDAGSEQAARASMRSLQGEFSQKIREIVEELIQLRIFVEAAIDFTEEEIDFLEDKQITSRLKEIQKKLNNIQSAAVQGSLLRDGMTIVIAGEPNVGKSSLLNSLSGKESAIVTDIPGTTRDVLREQLHLDGMPIHIIDTAGLRETEDLVEKEGIRRAEQEIKQADLVLYLSEANKEKFLKEFNIPTIYIKNKIDLTSEKESVKEVDGKKVVSLSAKTGAGIELLKKSIQAHVGFQVNNEGTFSARRRHLDAIKRAQQCIISGEKQLKDFKAGELLAEDLRQAQQALCEITGEFTSDDLLGRIFGTFCIGK